jgi:hypothetical protein
MKVALTQEEKDKAISLLSVLDRSLSGMASLACLRRAREANTPIFGSKGTSTTLHFDQDIRISQTKVLLEQYMGISVVIKNLCGLYDIEPDMSDETIKKLEAELLQYL